MQAPMSFPFARKALVTSLLPLMAGGAQASLGGYGGYAGHRRGLGTPFQAARQVVVIDPQVRDYEKLLAGLPAEAEVIVLSGKGDGVAEMAAALRGREDIDALHIISHGAMGRVKLGDGTLSSATLEQHTEALGIISGALSEHGDLLIYGCRTGEGASGRAFVRNLALVTGADVAASDDLTGASASGGDWDLEVSAGAIESALPVDAQPWQQFSGVLLADGTQDVGLNTTSNFVDNGATASNGYFVISGKSGIDLAAGSFSHAYVTAQAIGDYWIRVDADGTNVQSFQLTSIYMGEWSAANSFLNVSVTGYLAGGGTVTMSGPESSLDSNAYDNFGAALSNTNQYLTGFRIDFNADPNVANNWANDLALFSFDIANAQSPNAAPVFTAAGPFSIDETATAGAAVGNVDAHDGENSGADVNVTYAIQSGNPNSDGDGNPALAIDTNSGAITVNDADDLDYEISTGSTLTIRATDDQGAMTDQTVTVNVVDIAPAIVSGQSFGVNESDSNGKVLGTVATTGDDDSVTFSIQSGNTDSAFGINAATGQITLVDTSKLDASVTGSYVLTVRADDGDNGSQYSEQPVTVSVTDDIAPSVTGSGPGAAQPGDATVDFTVTFDEPVTGVSADDFAMTSTGSAKATTSTVTGSGKSYIVTLGSIDGEGTLRLDLKAGTDIDDGSGNTPAAYTSGIVHTVDRIPPAVTSVNVPVDGTYSAGDVLTLSANFAESVSVGTSGGTPSIPITLDAGGTANATYVSGGGTSALTFAYTVQSGDADSNGITVGASIVLNGGTLRDAAGNDADTTLNGVASTAGVLVDTTDIQPPVVSAPADLTINATGLFTATELGTASAVDARDGSIAVIENDAPERFAPGRHTVTWSATDAAGNTGTAEQQVDVLPLVSAGPDQVTGEGSAVTVPVLLNGNAPAYPVTISYTVAGTADATDHDLTDGTLTIYSGVEGSITFTTTDDGVTGEADETVVLNLEAPTGAALGIQAAQTVTIREGNVDPQVDLAVAQSGITGTTVAADGGPVTVTARVKDPNGGSHTFDWSGSDTLLLDTDASADTLTFDPSRLEPGVYDVMVTVTDDDTVPGNGGAVETLRVLAAAPVLTSTDDTDGDGIDDLAEGPGDSNGNGIPDYLDTLVLQNVLPERSGNSASYLIESPAGTSLGLGAIALGAGGGQAAIVLDSLPADDNAANTGGLFDFKIRGFSSGAAENVVIPQAEAIPPQAAYRKWSTTGWTDFVQDGSNAVASAPGAPGYCPPPGSDAYTAGLTEGHWCVQLTIQDGGANDSVPTVPGYIGQTGGVGIPSANQSGSASTNPPARRDPFEGGSGALGAWALLGLVPLLWRRRRR